MPDLTEMITSTGFTREMLILLLYVPLLATVVNFSRYFVGMRTLGIYAPMTLSFAYIFVGIRYGLLITIAVILATMLSYSFLRGIRMHYLSRISINYIFITAFVIGIMMLNEVSPIPVTTENHNLASVPPLGIILVATLSDFFIKQYVKKSFMTSVRSLGETVAVGFIGWLLLKSTELQDFLYDNLWFMLILLIINLWLGSYTGLRLKDLLRFKPLIEND